QDHGYAGGRRSDCDSLALCDRQLREEALEIDGDEFPPSTQIRQGEQPMKHTDAAEAMPESKFNFSPENLHIAGGDKGVRTFALQIRHIAASNYAIWSALTSDPFPKDFLGGNRPET